MKPVKIYTTPICPYCTRAKRLLDTKGVPYEEIDVSGDDQARMDLAERTGRRTVPQIFIGEEHIGGFYELRELERSGELEQALVSKLGENYWEARGEKTVTLT
jgi:glutaredoxin 3